MVALRLGTVIGPILPGEITKAREGEGTQFESGQARTQPGPDFGMEALNLDSRSLAQPLTFLIL